MQRQRSQGRDHLAHQGDVGGIVLDVQQGGLWERPVRRCDDRHVPPSRSRQGHDEVQTVGARRSGQSAAHRLDQSPRQRQVHGFAPMQGGVAEGFKRLEQRLQLRRRRRSRRVRHPHDEFGVVFGLERDRNHAVRRASADRVADQRRQRLVQAPAIGGDANPGLGRGKAQGDPAVLRQRRQTVADLTQKDLRIHALYRQGHASRLKAGEGRPLVDQVPQFGAGAQNLMHGLILPTGQRLGRPIHSDQFGEANHGVERRSEFMAQAIEEVGLGLAGFGKPKRLGARQLQRLIQRARAFPHPLLQRLVLSQQTFRPAARPQRRRPARRRRGERQGSEHRPFHAPSPGSMGSCR